MSDSETQQSAEECWASSLSPTFEQVTIEGLSVEVEAGIVTLEGKVATPAEKHLAARRARNIIGVRGVVNAIDVEEALKLLR